MQTEIAQKASSHQVFKIQNNLAPERQGKQRNDENALVEFKKNMSDFNLKTAWHCKFFRVSFPGVVVGNELGSRMLISITC